MRVSTDSMGSVVQSNAVLAGIGHRLETGVAEFAAGTFPVAAPDAVLLPVLQRVLEALGAYGAAGAHLFGVGVLVAAREEQGMAHVFAAGLFTPVSHGRGPSWWRRRRGGRSGVAAPGWA